MASSLKYTERPLLQTGLAALDAVRQRRMRVASEHRTLLYMFKLQLSGMLLWMPK